MTKKATEDLMDELHGLTAETLRKLVKDMKSGDLEPKASVLAQAIKFLKDNNTTALPGNSGPIDGLLAEVEDYPFQSDSAH